MFDTHSVLTTGPSTAKEEAPSAPKKDVPRSTLAIREAKYLDEEKKLKQKKMEKPTRQAKPTTKPASHKDMELTPAFQEYVSGLEQKNVQLEGEAALKDARIKELERLLEARRMDPQN